jgi:hypothetical protein
MIQGKTLHTEWKYQEGKFAGEEPQLRFIISTSNFISLMGKEASGIEVERQNFGCQGSVSRGNLPKYPSVKQEVVAFKSES